MKNILYVVSILLFTSYLVGCGWFKGDDGDDGTTGVAGIVGPSGLPGKDGTDGLPGDLTLFPSYADLKHYKKELAPSVFDEYLARLGVLQWKGEINYFYYVT